MITLGSARPFDSCLSCDAPAAVRISMGNDRQTTTIRLCHPCATDLTTQIGSPPGGGSPGE